MAVAEFRRGEASLQHQLDQDAAVSDQCRRLAANQWARSKYLHRLAGGRIIANTDRDRLSRVVDILGGVRQPG